jgi:hypothetical protein
MLIGGLNPKDSLLDISTGDKFISATDVDFTSIDKRLEKIESKQNIIMILVGILVILQLKDILK